MTCAVSLRDASPAVRCRIAADQRVEGVAVVIKGDDFDM